MKKILCLILTTCIILSNLCCISFAQGNFVDAWDVIVMVNGKRVVQDSNGVPLVIKTAWLNQGAVNLAPVRAVCEALGTQVNWNGEKNTVTVYNEFVAVAMQVDNSKITIGRKTADGGYNDIVTEMVLVSPVNINGTIYIPIRAVAEGFGATVEWVQDEKMIRITSQAQNAY